MTPISNFILRLFMPVLVLSLLSCERGSNTGPFRHADFNSDWKFRIGEFLDAADPSFDDSRWTPVHLPHDWSIVDYEIQDSFHIGPFYKNLTQGDDVGYLRNGTAWYRKAFMTPENRDGEQYIIDFDGVQTQMELWVNGEKMGEHVYGYTPFKFNITAALNEPGASNIIAVKTMNAGENSRWFTGAGIYRPVTISILNPVSAAPWGVYLTTSRVTAEDALVNVEVTVDNRLETDAEIQCEVQIISPENEITELSTNAVLTNGHYSAVMEASVRIMNPMLWNVDQPNLYKAVVTILSNGKETDRYQSTFGIRSIEYSVGDGFLINGEEILMKGACMHHDNGLLGAAAFPMAERRRVRIMKENGFNAIRTSHNPPSEDFLNACDSIGMLVIDESFDHWIKPKRSNDYSNYFEQWHIRDVQAMAYRDRNHPSVVMWSFGNEVQERADPEGIEIGKTLIAAIREIDNTRPVTQAVCRFWDNPGKEWDYSAGAFGILDIGGYNYEYLNYESDHLKYPDRIMYGSESAPQHAWENWEMVKKHSYVIGDFVWTGMDYLGESGIGHNFYSGDDDSFLPPWPWYVSWCGDIDILGNKKPQSHYRDVVWGESNLEIMVSRPVPDGKIPRISYWGWHDELNSWNWEGHEGQPMKVRVYSSFPEVRLELNGNVVGTRRIGPDDKYLAEFDLKYSPGELKATGMNGDEVMESVALKTADAEHKLLIDPETDQLTADKNSIAYIHVLAIDQDGVYAVTDESEVVVKVSGPAKLQAAGNANPMHQGSFTDGIFNLFRGKGMVIVRSTGEPGEIVVEVSSEGMQSVRIKLLAV
jgi:beta-galactosidase